MGMADYIIIALVMVIAAASIKYIRKNKGGCSGCQGCQNTQCAARGEKDSRKENKEL